MTCIPSNFDVGTHGDSEGPVIRYGARMILADSIIDGGRATAEARASPRTSASSSTAISNNDTSNAAAAGESTLNRTVIACQEAYVSGTADNLVNGDTGLQWIAGAGTAATYAFNTFNVVITDPANANVRVLQPNTFFSFDDERRGATTVDDRRRGRRRPSTIGAVGQSRHGRLHRRRAQHGELDRELDLRLERRQSRHHALVGMSRALGRQHERRTTTDEESTWHNCTPPRRTPLALLVATLVGSGAAAQDAPTDAAAAGPDPDIEEIVTIGRLRSTALDVVGARLEEDVVSDFLGAAAISRVGDSTVSAALRRVPGLTLVNDQFVYVRGLGERYSSVQLNGAQVPSPDLTRNVIPLDIFPTEIIDALQVQKGYSPEVPAAFGGGNVDIRTRSIPNGPIVNIEIGSGLNSDAIAIRATPTAAATATASAATTARARSPKSSRPASRPTSVDINPNADPRSPQWRRQRSHYLRKPKPSTATSRFR